MRQLFGGTPGSGALLLFLCWACACTPAQGRSERGPQPECRKSADCVLVPEGCCGCNQGGKRRAIPARARADYEAKREAACRDTMCPAVMSKDPSCGVEAACKEGRCVLGS